MLGRQIARTKLCNLVYRSRAGGQKLQTIGDMLKTVAESLDSSGQEGIAPISMYRLHVRMEKGPKKNGFQEQYPTLNFW